MTAVTLLRWKIFILSLCIFAGCYTHHSAAAQSLTIEHIDSTDFPTMRAIVRMVGADTQLLDAGRAGNVALHDNSSRVEDLAISALPGTRLDSVSLLICLESRLLEEPANRQLIIETLREVLAIPQPGSAEFALTLFQRDNLMAQDYTIDPLRLIGRLEDAQNWRSDEVPLAYLTANDLPFGYTQNVGNAQFPRRIITIGSSPGATGFSDPVLAALRQAGDLAYSVQLLAAGDDNEAEARVFVAQDDILLNNLEQPRPFAQTLRNVVLHALDSRAFQLEWTSRARCPGSQQIAVSSPQFRKADTSTYLVAAELLPRLEYRPQRVSFGFVPLGAFRDTALTLRVKGAETRFDAAVSSNPQFQIIQSPPRGTRLAAGETVQLTLRYRPQESGYSSGRVTLATGLCDIVEIECSGGDVQQATANGLQLLAPQEGERLGEHHLYTIRWSGVANSTPVRLEFSSDGGQSWALISDQARGGSFQWLVPVLNGAPLQLRASLYQAPGFRESPEFETVRGLMPSTLAISPDGTMVANSNNTNGIDVFSASSGALLQTLALPRPSSLDILEWHPDGEHLAYVVNGNDLVIININSGASQEHRDFSPNRIEALRWSPTGNLVACTDWRGNVVVWNYRTGKELRRSAFGTQEYNVDLAWTGSENYVVIVRSDNRVIAWAWENENINPFTVPELGESTRRVLGGLSGETFAILSNGGSIRIVEADDPTNFDIVVEQATRAQYFAWHHGRNSFFLGSFSGSEIEEWDASGGGLLAQIPLGGFGLRQLDLSLRSDRLTWFYSPSENLEEIGVYDLTSSTQLARITGVNSRAYAIDWTPDAASLEIADGGALLRWNAADQNIVRVAGFEDQRLVDYQRSPTTGGFAAITASRELTIFANDGTVRAQQRVDWSSRDVRWRPTRDQISCRQQNYLLLLDGPSGGIVRQRDFGRSVASYVWEPSNGRRAAVLTQSEQLILWDADTGEEQVFTFTDPVKRITLRALAWHPRQDIIAVASGADYLALLDLQTGQIEQLYIGVETQNQSVLTMDWADDGERLAVAYNRQIVQIIDFAGGPNLSLKLAPVGVIQQLDWNPNGEQLAIRPSLGEIQVWNTRYSRSSAESTTVNLSTAPAVIQFLDAAADPTSIFVNIAAYQNPLIVNEGERPFTYVDIDFRAQEWRRAFRQRDGSWPRNVTVAAGDTLELPLTFAPSVPGRLEETLRVIVGNTLVSATLRGVAYSSEVLRSVRKFDVGAAFVGSTPIDAEIASFLTNNSSEQRTISDIQLLGPHAEWFEMRDEIVGRVLEPGEQLDLRLRFTPAYAGSNSAIIVYSIDGFQQQEDLHVYAEAIPASLEIADFAAAAGESTAARLSFSNADEMRSAGLQASRCRVELEYDVTVLVPEVFVDARPTGREHRVRAGFDLEWDGASTVLGDVAFTAALGHVEQSAVRITGFAWLDAAAVNNLDEVQGGSAIFTLENLCRIDGTRLFDPFGASPEIRVLPNPVTDIAEIVFISIERGDVEFDIFDQSGQAVWQTRRQIIRPGQYRVSADLSSLPNGLYLIRMRSLAVELYSSLVILR